MIEEISMSINYGASVPGKISFPTDMSQSEISIIRDKNLKDHSCSLALIEDLSKPKRAAPVLTPGTVLRPVNQQSQNTPDKLRPANSSSMQAQTQLPTSSKKIKYSKIVDKLNKSLEDFFLKDGPEESSYVDEISIMKHYNM
jgi:hypothetical protein